MMTEKENFIQLKKDNIFRVAIIDADGKDTGEHLEFDLESVDLALKLNECEAKHRRNLEYLQGQFVIIDKKEDKKGKFLLSWKEEEKLKALKEYYNKEIEALDLFLGEGGTKKLLNGRNPYYSMYDDIGEMLEPILPKLKIRSEDIKNSIMSKYKKEKEEVEVLE